MGEGSVMSLVVTFPLWESWDEFWAPTGSQSVAFPYQPATASALCPACQLLAGVDWPSVDPSRFVWAWSPCLDPFLCLTSCSEGITCLRACVHAKSLQLCPNLCDHMDCSPPSSSVCGILQARILEWIVISSSSVSS